MIVQRPYVFVSDQGRDDLSVRYDLSGIVHIKVHNSRKSHKCDNNPESGYQIKAFKLVRKLLLPSLASLDPFKESFIVSFRIWVEESSRKVLNIIHLFRIMIRSIKSIALVPKKLCLVYWNVDEVFRLLN